VSRRPLDHTTANHSAPPSLRTRRWFAVVTVAVVIVPFIILETALRLFHYGSEYELVGTATEHGSQYYYLNPTVGKRYFDPAKYFLPKVERTYFEVEKSANTFRVFCLGASTTAGFPYSYNLTPSFLLKKQLELALPDRRIEVVNAGLTATNSYTVVEFLRELAHYHPDLFVIYTGQNEFYGALGTGSSVSIGQYRWVIRMYLSLRRLKTFILFEESLTAVSHTVFGSAGPVMSGTLMEQMAKDKAIAYNSPTYRRALDSYRKNIDDMLDIAREAGIPVVLSTLVTNERSLPPFVSLHDERLSNAQKKETEAMLTRGQQLQQHSEYLRALQEYRQAAATDPVYALTQFRMGECYEQIGRMDSARTAYGAARDLDGLRFRASAEENHIVRSLAHTPNVTIADIDSAFRLQSPGGIPGKELLWEHVHPTLDGYVLLARSWYAAMSSVPFSSAFICEHLQKQISDSLLRATVHCTALDAEFGAQTMERLLHRWPFSPDAVPETPQGDLQRAARLFIDGSLRWNEAHYEMADAYLKEHKIAEAAREFEAVNTYYPDDPFPLMRMGDMYALLGKNDLATDALLRVLGISETQFIHLKLGVLYLQPGARSDAPERALTHLSRAFEIDEHATSHFSRAQFAEAAYSYSLALFRLGRTEEAKQTLSMLLQNDPANAKARRLFKEMETRREVPRNQFGY
jgi:tetratricopeptide (TPR) repeat protein